MPYGQCPVTGHPLTLACENCGGQPRGMRDNATRPCRCPYDWDGRLGGAVARYKLIVVADDREVSHDS